MKNAQEKINLPLRRYAVDIADDKPHPKEYIMRKGPSRLVVSLYHVSVTVAPTFVVPLARLAFFYSYLKSCWGFCSQYVQFYDCKLRPYSFK